MKKASHTKPNPKDKYSAEASAALELQSKSVATRAERKDLGKQARQDTPIQAHAKWVAPTSGRDIIKVLEKSNEGRIPDLIPLRYGRMLVSPFTFYRGSASLMALDLVNTPNSGFRTQVCGDCHIHNFGLFASPERKIIIDINDFDETLPAPWEWDIKRLAASLVLAATANGFSEEFAQEAAMLMVEGYREHMRELSAMNPLQVWYSHVTFEHLIEMSSEEARRRQKTQLRQEMEKSSPEAMTQKLTEFTHGRLRFKDIPPLICHTDGLTADQLVQEAFQDYRQSLSEARKFLLDKFQLVDIARKVVGIGSVGTMCGVALLAGSDDDSLILQVKEARASVLEPYAGASKYKHHGQRVVQGQKLMQAASDMFLGWTTGRRAPYRHFYIRQLRDVKIGVNTTFWTKAEFRTYPKLAGEILARAHARSGDPAILRGYMGKSDEFDEAIGEFAVAYARQTERDYMQFVKACKSGKLKAETIE